MTLRTVLLSLQALLSAAEPDDPQDAVVAKQFKAQPELFRQTAKHWTSVYAGGMYIFRFSQFTDILQLNRYMIVLERPSKNARLRRQNKATN